MADHRSAMTGKWSRWQYSCIRSFMSFPLAGMRHKRTMDEYPLPPKQAKWWRQFPSVSFLFFRRMKSLFSVGPREKSPPLESTIEYLHLIAPSPEFLCPLNPSIRGILPLCKRYRHPIAPSDRKDSSYRNLSTEEA